MFIWLGRASFLGAIICTTGALASTIGLLLSQPRRLPMKAPIVLCAIAVVCFLTKAPSSFNISFGAAFYLFWVGWLACVGGELLSLEYIANLPEAEVQNATEQSPGDESTAAVSVVPPPEGAPVPACTKCEAPTVWVAKHSRYFCKDCKHYL